MDILRRARIRGFTLVELAAVIGMVGILATVATIAVIRAQANNEETQARQAIDAVTSAQIDFARRYGGYTAFPDDLALPEGPALTTSVSSSPRVVSVAISSDGTVGLASGNGRNRCVLRVLEPLMGGADTADRRADANEGCLGASALGDRDLAQPTSQVPQ
jgi:prepilin-type N-terminal cleavage/methylation domain-containing protein